MIEITFAVAVAAAVTNLALSVPFVRALRQEAPDVLASFVAPDIWGHAWRANRRVRYARLILLREYRSRLAACPQSRAWASWLFLVHWIQLITVAIFFLALLMR